MYNTRLPNLWTSTTPSALLAAFFTTAAATCHQLSHFRYVCQGILRKGGQPFKPPLGAMYRETGTYSEIWRRPTWLIRSLYLEVAYGTWLGASILSSYLDVLEQVITQLVLRAILPILLPIFHQSRSKDYRVIICDYHDENRKTFPYQNLVSDAPEIGRTCLFHCLALIQASITRIGWPPSTILYKFNYM